MTNIWWQVEARNQTRKGSGTKRTSICQLFVSEIQKSVAQQRLKLMALSPLETAVLVEATGVVTFLGSKTYTK